MSEANYSKRSFPARLVDEGKYQNAEAGDFFYMVNDAGEKVGLSSCLPNAMDQGLGWGATMFSNYTGAGPKWTWDGNVNSPTLTPSIHRVGHWHGFLTKGQFQSC